MQKSKTGKGVIVGKNVQFSSGVTVWNYVVIGDNVRIGDGTRVGSFCDIGSGVVIGKNCNIQAHVTISNGCKIGNNVFIAPNSSLLNDKFPLSKCLTPSVIEDDVVIGGCAVILPNLTIGESSVVAAGSIVTKDVSPRTVVKGTPALALMTREEYEDKKKAFINAKQR
jgi:UDP-2-acetamido-3-amino-2,3-dideoxy-glucuronate N-acetyltransferase